MRCEELHWADRGTRPLSAEERAHVDACPRCQLDLALHGAMKRSDAAPALPDALRAQVQAELAREPRARPWWRPWLVGSGVALLLAGAAELMMRLRPDLRLLPWADVALNVLLMLAAFALAGRAAFGPGLAPRGRASAAGVAVLAAAALLALPGPHGGLPGGHAACFAAILGISALPMVVLFALVRTRTRAWSSGLFAGLAAGALGEAALFLDCPFSGTGHLLATHLAAWAALAGIGAVLLALFPARIWTGARK